MIKKILNKWQVEFNFTPDWFRGVIGWWVFKVGIFKITSFPPEGCYMAKTDYKGFRLSIGIFVPIYIDRQ